jgi:hypothetical protein
VGDLIAACRRNAAAASPDVAAREERFGVEHTTIQIEHAAVVQVTPPPRPSP